MALRCVVCFKDSFEFDQWSIDGITGIVYCTIKLSAEVAFSQHFKLCIISILIPMIWVIYSQAFMDVVGRWNGIFFILILIFETFTNTTHTKLFILILFHATFTNASHLSHHMFGAIFQSRIWWFGYLVCSIVQLQHVYTRGWD